MKRNIVNEKDKLDKWNFVNSVRTWLDFSARISSDLLFHMYWVEIFKILTRHNEETFCSYLQNEHFTLSSALWDATWRGKGYSLNALDSFWSVIEAYVVPNNPPWSSPQLQRGAVLVLVTWPCNSGLHSRGLCRISRRLTMPESSLMMMAMSFGSKCWSGSHLHASHISSICSYPSDLPCDSSLSTCSAALWSGCGSQEEPG